MPKFQRVKGDWKRFRNLPHTVEFDLHRSNLFYAEAARKPPYEERMAQVYDNVFARIVAIYEEGMMRYLLITHGHSTSRSGVTSSRSQVRKLVRSSHVTPYVIRSECLQHESVFVVAIKPKKRATTI